MSPLERYRELLESGRLLADPAQVRAVDALDSLFRQLLAVPLRTRRRLWTRLRGAPVVPVRGLYLWGGVGRGKTRLMDLFFERLPWKDRQRVHFHRFMGEVHQALAGLEGRKNPLERVAGRLAGRTRVLCLDELQVWDIGDAMILGGLLEALFRHGLTLVVTSNSAPEGLYPNGLQRALFLPAIAQLRTHTRVLELDSPTDYRSRLLQGAGLYHAPLDAASEQVLAGVFERIATMSGIAGGTLSVNGRPIAVRRRAEGVLWVDFEVLCDGPRSRADYLELARCHHTLLVSGVPVMDDGHNDRAKRFIHLVDVLYDHNVTLVLSAAADPGELYRGEGLAFEFRRTASRLYEMRSRQWLERPHLG